MVSSLIRFLLSNADKWLHQGAGCESASISRSLVTKLLKSGAPTCLVDRAKKLVLIIALDTQKIVTVINRISLNTGRRYQRQHDTHKY